MPEPVSLHHETVLKSQRASDLAMNSTSSNIHMEGFPCHLDLLKLHRAKILQEMTLAPALAADVGAFLEQVRSEHSEAAGVHPLDVVFVGVHNRRSDYLEHMKKMYGRAHTMSIKFYEVMFLYCTVEDYDLEQHF